MNQKILMAGMTSLRTVEYRLSSPLTPFGVEKIRVLEGDRKLPITRISLPSDNATLGCIELDEELSLFGSYRVEIEGYGEKTVIPTAVFDSAAFAERYHYDGELGALTDGKNTTFTLWAPTASRVVLNLFAAGSGAMAYKSLDMTRGERGVWSHTAACGSGTYYTYSVTTAVGTQEAVDPYAKALGVNGERGMVIDLSLTNPEGFADSKLTDPIQSYSEAVIWEIHVRDFSGKIASSKYRGKFLAFTERGLVNEHGVSVGVDYLKKLGITHVHLLPVFDFATVDEVSCDRFNWGYDPANYNAPDGSYATDPYHGEIRIREFKQMVQSLHEAGIGVITDMVYNHTYEANNSLNKIVPYYYYRYTELGENTSASGCGNDTASERYMFGKFMVDSTSYWVREYKLDGLRFDLMGLHDLGTMQNVERAVHAINPSAILYGEGWTMGATVDGSEQANQTHIAKIKPLEGAIGGISVFSDVMRDGLKGSAFDQRARGFINGAPRENFSKVAFGMCGGTGEGQSFRVERAEVINYMSAHDNNTLWDKLLLSNPDDDSETRAKMNKLGAAIVMMSKGTPFFQAGEEMLRTKGGDENSYRSSDDVNNIDWSVLREGSLEYRTMQYYKGLIQMRKAYSVFTDRDARLFLNLCESGLATVYFASSAGEALALINPNAEDISLDIYGEWQLVADGERAGTDILARESGLVSVSPYSARIYIR